MNRRLSTDTIAIPIIEGELDTTRAIPAPWLRPPVTATYRRRPSRWQQIRRSQFARDVVEGTGNAAAILGGACAGYVFLLIVLHMVVGL